MKPITLADHLEVHGEGWRANLLRWLLRRARVHFKLLPSSGNTMNVKIRMGWSVWLATWAAKVLAW